MFEQIIIAVTLGIFLGIERFCQKPRLIVFRPSEESPHFSRMFLKKDQVTDDIAGGARRGDMSFWPLAEKSTRQQRLKGIIDAVRKQKDTQLNERLDIIMDQEMKKVKERNYNSDEDRYLKPIVGKKHFTKTEEFLNTSFPGAGSNFYNPMKKCLSLL